MTVNGVEATALDCRLSVELECVELTPQMLEFADDSDGFFCTSRVDAHGAQFAQPGLHFCQPFIC